MALIITNAIIMISNHSLNIVLQTRFSGSKRIILCFQHFFLRSNVIAIVIVIEMITRQNNRNRNQSRLHGV